MKTYPEYPDYDSIPSDVFQDVILDLAARDFATVLELPGIYEIISEEFNNEALDILCPNANCPE